MSPLVLKELRSPEQEPADQMLVLAAAIFLTLGLVMAWLVPHPVLFQVRHAPLAIASALVLYQMLLAGHRARLVMDERDGRTYETLILSGAAGWGFVAGMVQSSMLRALAPMAQMAPLFVAASVAVGVPAWPIVAFHALALAHVALVSALAVQAAGDAASGARAGRAGGDAPESGGRVPHRALWLPIVSAALLIPVWALAVGGTARQNALAWLGGPLTALMAFCPASVFVIESVPVFGVAVPFLPVAVLLNLGAAALPMARAAARHRHRRHDTSTVRRALSLAAFLVSLGLLAATGWPGRGFGSLATLAVAHLVLMLMLAPDATDPAWPATAPGDAPGHGRMADVFRERCGTGLAYVALLDLAAGPLYLLAGPGRVALWTWCYATVASLAWAALSFELPRNERPGADRVGLRAAVVALTLASAASLLWDETVATRQPAWLVGPVRFVLAVAVLTSPLTGLLGLASTMVAIPALRRGSFHGPAQLCHTTIEGLFWLSLGWYAALAVLGWLRARWQVRGSRPPDPSSPSAAPPPA
jgi:hypothetical protein